MPGRHNVSTRIRRWSTALGVTAAVVLAISASSSAAPLTLVVNSVGNAVDASPGNGVCEVAPGNGICTLRAAIQEANASAGHDTIKFNIGGGGNATIAPPSPLPAVTDPATVDATTQPGYAGSPLIQLDGHTALGSFNGFTLTAGSSVIRGFAIEYWGAGLLNVGSGIKITGSGGNHIVGNYIGTDRTGTIGQGNNGNGVWIVSSANNVIGGTTAADRNVISGNGNAVYPIFSNGVRTEGAGASGNVIEGNYIGVKASGLSRLGNGNVGVFIGGGPNLVGGMDGVTPGGACTGACNVISGNAAMGVTISGLGASGTVVQANMIGPDKTGNAVSATRNSGGLAIGSSTNNLIGGSAPGAANTISGNGQLVVGSPNILNSGPGMDIEGEGVTKNNRIEGNRIGTNSAGTAPLPNYNAIIVNASGQTIGGTDGVSPGGACTGACNLISGNQSHQVILGSGGSRVVGNFFGTDVAGQTRIPAGGDDINIMSFGSTIGGTTPEERNVISGASIYGVDIATGGAVNNVIEGNYIGTDSTGTAAIPNRGGGVNSQIKNNRIGGTDGVTPGGPCTGACNLISGNGLVATSEGIRLTGPFQTVQGNFIGTDYTGTAALPNNVEAGILVEATSDVQIGGTTPAEGNLISGNNGLGVAIYARGLPAIGVRRVHVEGNRIGTAADGTSPLGNGTGVNLAAFASNNTIGGTAPGAGNIIAFNRKHGVATGLDASPGHSIRRNSIFENGGLGIDHPPKDIVNQNDKGDGDALTFVGGHDLQNFPVLASVRTTGSSVTIEGDLNSRPNQNYTLEFFSNPACDPSGYGEGKTFLGDGVVTTNGAGDTHFTFTFAAAVTAAEAVTSTATNQLGSTSEFSKCGPAVVSSSPTLKLTPEEATNGTGTTHCVTATVRNAAGAADVGAAVRFSVAGANTATGTRTTDAAGKAQFCYIGTVAGTDSIAAFADGNGDGDKDAGEPSDTATKTWIELVPPLKLDLTPETATNSLGTDHCVTATVKDSVGTLGPGITIVFSVSGANTASETGTTNVDGTATFCYTGANAGSDGISAFADLDEDGLQDDGEPSDTASKTWLNVRLPLALDLTPGEATNPVGDEHCVTATLTDADGTPVPDTTIVFSVTGANNASGTATTDANGKAHFCYTGTSDGDDTIAAYADANGNNVRDADEANASATKKWVIPPPTVVTLDPPTATNRAGEEHCVTATVADANGRPSRNVTVVFVVSGVNTRTDTKLTDSAGKAVSCYTGTVVGSDSIHAFADADNDGEQDEVEPGATAAKTWIPASPRTLDVTPETAVNVAGVEHCVTATVKDVYDNPTPNVDVIFTVTGANSASGTKITRSDGAATFCYTGTKTGDDTITAFADDDHDGTKDELEPVDTAAKTYVAGNPATLALTPKTATNPAGAEHCVTATVRDAYGNLTPNVTVIFSVTGTHSAGASRTTSSTGEATFCYVGRKVGSDSIGAFADTNQDALLSVGEPSDTASKTWVHGPAALLTLTPKTATNVVGQQHCVTATLTDTYENVIADARIVFSVTGANPAGAAKTTDANGQAVFCYTGTKSGTDTITAFADGNTNSNADLGEPSDTAQKTWLKGARILTLTPKTATNPVGTQHCVTATVKDQYGNAYQGDTIVFTVSGSVARSGSATTDANGEARFCYTGSTSLFDVTGRRNDNDAIKAYDDLNKNAVQDTGEPSDTATKTWVAGPATSVVLGPKTGSAVVGTSYCLTATLKDQYGNPASNMKVVFSTSGANAATATKTTDANGKATSCYTGARAGADNASAYADKNANGIKDTGEPSDTAAVTWCSRRC
jgi:CSLREA domain-containing protein